MSLVFDKVSDLMHMMDAGEMTTTISDALSRARGDFQHGGGDAECCGHDGDRKGELGRVRSGAAQGRERERRRGAFAEHVLVPPFHFDWCGLVFVNFSTFKLMLPHET